jgi:hypothetical protein
MKKRNIYRVTRPARPNQKIFVESIVHFAMHNGKLHIILADNGLDLVIQASLKLIPPDEHRFRLNHKYMVRFAPVYLHFFGARRKAVKHVEIISVSEISTHQIALDERFYTN